MKLFGKVRHPFLCTDPGTGKLMWFSSDGKIEKELNVQSNCYDVWQLPNGEILYPHYEGGCDGVTLLDKSGNKIFTYETKGEVFGCQPLKNGNILVGEVAQKRICEVTKSGKIVKEISVESSPVPHECMRMPRKYENGYFVVQPGLNQIVLFDDNGNSIRKYTTYHDTFGIVQKQNGNILYTHMEGVTELDINGNEVWTLRNCDVPEINIRWLLGIQLLKNGNIVLSNWMGHGHLREGIQFFEVTPNKELVWYCDCRDETMIPSSLQILDEDASDVCFGPLR